MTARMLLLLCFLGFLSGCKDPNREPRTEEEIYQETIKQYEELALELSKVVDEKTARDSRTRVGEIGDKLARLKELKDIRDKRESKSVSVGVKYEITMITTSRKVVNQYVRIRQQVPAAQKLASEVKAILENQGLTVPKV